MQRGYPHPEENQGNTHIYVFLTAVFSCLVVVSGVVDCSLQAFLHCCAMQSDSNWGSNTWKSSRTHKKHLIIRNMVQLHHREQHGTNVEGCWVHHAGDVQDSFRTKVVDSSIATTREASLQAYVLQCPTNPVRTVNDELLDTINLSG